MLAIAAAGVLAWAAVFHHVGAPALHYPCQPPDHTVLTWVPDSRFHPAPDPGPTVRWAGYTEYAGCAETLTLSLGTVPVSPDRFIYGQHEHTVMGAVTGIYDQPDGKYLYLALALIAVVVLWRPRRGVQRRQP